MFVTVENSLIQIYILSSKIKIQKRLPNEIANEEFSLPEATKCVDMLSLQIDPTVIAYIIMHSTKYMFAIFT